ncbi:ribosome maturation factor RimM [Blochmannia endosymbiont of Camponotus sp.]|uniref:ribosome maturation factor RimM n=1 Tax=Blochmannia endosymbiont of Camponotus sp. TaxID=700220 RepID=UPI00202529B4|nr:ribosome maturation factor RimM [Blochmannia endosymbiont of Camponotus sp.]URJ24094.1 ribosome maturation factor RimM [Blochmannia endosymbiont of Camponotus sp.]URJ25714.1 ribosome maturation factor RimM [Blochmannia endosymbiont of Camponotus sp.]
MKHDEYSRDKEKITTPPLHPVVIGRIIGAYGILGWVRIIAFTEKHDNMFYYSPYFTIIQSTWKEIFLDKWKLIGKCYIVKMRGISNRDSAQSLSHCDIIIDETQFPCIKDDEYYWKDLIGCVVITVQGVLLGDIISIIETTANDVLVVKIHQYNSYKVKNCLIPFLIKRVIKNINLVTRIVTVDWDPSF